MTAIDCTSDVQFHISLNLNEINLNWMPISCQHCTCRFFFLWKTMLFALTFLSLISTLFPHSTMGMFSHTRTRSRCQLGTFLYVMRAVTSNMMIAHWPATNKYTHITSCTNREPGTLYINYIHWPVEITYPVCSNHLSNHQTSPALLYPTRWSGLGLCLYGKPVGEPRLPMWLQHRLDI